jgi:hypothetical protein
MWTELAPVYTDDFDDEDEDLFELSTLRWARRSRKASSHRNKGSNSHNRARGLGRSAHRETTMTRDADNATDDTHGEREQHVSTAHLETTGPVNGSV